MTERLWPSNPSAPDLNGNDAVAVITLVWKWLGDHHFHSYTADDLIAELDQAGYPCPDALEGSS